MVDFLRFFLHRENQNSDRFKLLARAITLSENKKGIINDFSFNSFRVKLISSYIHIGQRNSNY